MCIRAWSTVRRYSCFNRFTAVAQGRDTLVVNDNWGTQKLVMKADVSPLTARVCLSIFALFFFPHPRHKHTLPISHPFLLSVHATAGLCYPQSSGAIHQHDKGVKREYARGNKSCVEYPQLKRLLKNVNNARLSAHTLQEFFIVDGMSQRNF